MKTPSICSFFYYSPYLFTVDLPWCTSVTGISNDCEDPYPSLSDYHDYEPNLEFDDTELQTTSNNGKTSNLS